MKHFIIDPLLMTVSEIDAIDLNDFRAIQAAIDDSLYEVVRPLNGTTLYVDENARIRTPRPERFLIATDPDAEPLSLFGKALMVLKTGINAPELIFPREVRVTALDHNWQHLGNFVTEHAASAGEVQHDFNFQAVLSDEKFVAATRVVLSTFERFIDAAVPSMRLCPILELKIDCEHLGMAKDLYEEVLEELGVSLDFWEEEDEEEKFVIRLPTGGGKEGLLDGGHRICRWDI